MKYLFSAIAAITLIFVLLLTFGGFLKSNQESKLEQAEQRQQAAASYDSQSQPVASELPDAFLPTPGIQQKMKEKNRALPSPLAILKAQIVGSKEMIECQQDGDCAALSTGFSLECYLPINQTGMATYQAIALPPAKGCPEKALAKCENNRCAIAD